jgi:hypothetical protein
MGSLPFRCWRAGKGRAGFGSPASVTYEKRASLILHGVKKIPVCHGQPGRVGKEGLIHSQRFERDLRLIV